MLRNTILRTTKNTCNSVSKQQCCYHPGPRLHKAFLSTLCIQSNTPVITIQNNIFKINYNSILKNVNGRNNKSLNIRNLGLCSVLPARYNSTESTVASNTTTTHGYIPDPPLLSTTGTEGASDVILNALGEPTLASLGLANNTPAGLVQMALETLHVSCNLPWWVAIMTGTIVIRLLLFPIIIRTQKHTANYTNNMPTVQKLQAKFSKARSSGNNMEAAKAAHELNDFMKRNNVKPFKAFMAPMVQMPIFISVFVGIRQLANLPVDSLTTGGMLWFTDLTVADPYFLLPAMSMATLLAVVEVGADGAPASATNYKLRLFLRAMPFFMFPFVMKFPAAMLCYWTTSNVFSLGQVMLLKIPAVRSLFDIPERIKHEKPLHEKKSFTQGFRDTMENSKFVAEMEKRHQVAEERFRQAGIAPVRKTYPYNPKLKTPEAIPKPVKKRKEQL